MAALGPQALQQMTSAWYPVRKGAHQLRTEVRDKRLSWPLLLRLWRAGGQGQAVGDAAGGADQQCACWLQCPTPNQELPNYRTRGGWALPLLRRPPQSGEPAAGEATSDPSQGTEWLDGKRAARVSAAGYALFKGVCCVELEKSPKKQNQSSVCR